MNAAPRGRPPAWRDLRRPLSWGLAVFGLWTCVLLARFGPTLLSDPYAFVHDDGRHFTVWLRALADPALFADDAIADYFTALTPVLFKMLFAPATWLGVDPVTWNYLALTPLCLGLFIYASSRFTRQLLPPGLERALVTVLLCFLLLSLVENQRTAALPRSFALPILMLSLAAFMERRLTLLAASLFLGALIYPVAVIVAGTAMAFLALAARRAPALIDRAAARALVVGGAASVAGLLPFLLSANRTGATVTLEQARDLPIFGATGRTKFFLEDGAQQIFCGERGGLLTLCQKYETLPWPFALAATLAVTFAALGACRAVYGARRTRRLAILLAALMAAGAILFAAAYWVAFKAHLPARYALFAFGLALCLCLAMLAACAVRAIVSRTPHGLRGYAHLALFVGALGACGHLAAAKLAGPLYDRRPEISAYLRGAPKETLVAGLPRYVDSIPAFANRSVFVSLELLVPYKSDYYETMAARVELLAEAHRAPVSRASIAPLIAEGVDYLLLDAAGDVGPWPGSFPEIEDLRGAVALYRSVARFADCLPVRREDLALVDLGCVDAALSPSLSDRR